MENISTSGELRNKIHFLEKEQAIKGQQLKEQFLRTYKGLKPVNLLTGSIKEIVSTPFIINTVVGATLGLATGYFSKRLIIGASGSIIRKLIGSAIQMGVTSLVTKQTDKLRSKGVSIIRYLFHKKE